MQIHFDRASFSPFGEPRFNDIDSAAPFAVLPVGPVRLTILDEDEADKLIKAACQIKDMFRQHEAERATTAQDDAGRAIAADLGDQAGDGAE